DRCLAVGLHDVAYLRGDVLVSVQSAEALAAELRLGMRAGAIADGAASCIRAMNRDSDEVVCPVRGRFAGLWRAGSENLVNIAAIVFEHHIDRRNRTEIAASVDVWHPRPLKIVALGIDHLERHR